MQPKEIYGTLGSGTEEITTLWACMQKIDRTN